MTAPTFWASCPWCAFQYDDTQPGLLIDHQDGHIRALRDELKVTAQRLRDSNMRARDVQHREQAARDYADAAISAARELLAVLT